MKTGHIVGIMDGEARVADDGYSVVDIGADEVDCEDTWHEHDWTCDGAVNMEEFAMFSAAWLSRDPNEYGDPNLADPNETEYWNPVCNLDPNGTSQYVIDMADLLAFCEDSPEMWLWQACWRQDYMVMYGMSGGGESMMSIPSGVEGMAAPMAMAEPIQSVYQPTPAEKAATIDEILDFLNKILEGESPQNKDGILEMKDVLEGWLDEIEL